MRTMPGFALYCETTSASRDGASPGRPDDPGGTSSDATVIGTGGNSRQRQAPRLAATLAASASVATGGAGCGLLRLHRRLRQCRGGRLRHHRRMTRRRRGARGLGPRESVNRRHLQRRIGRLRHRRFVLRTHRRHVRLRRRCLAGATAAISGAGDRGRDHRRRRDRAGRRRAAVRLGVGARAREILRELLPIRARVVASTTGGGGTVARFGYEPISALSRFSVNGAVAGTGSFLVIPVAERSVSIAPSQPESPAASASPRSHTTGPPQRGRALRDAISKTSTRRPRHRPRAPGAAGRERVAASHSIRWCIRSQRARHYI